MEITILQILFWVSWVAFGIMSALYLMGMIIDDILDSKWKREYLNPCNHHSRGSFIVSTIIGGMFGFIMIAFFVILYFETNYKNWTWFHKPICKKEE